jgi:hypothetical protein
MPPGWERAGPVVTAAIFSEWARLIRYGWLAEEALHEMRYRLVKQNEFERGPAWTEMVVMVDDALGVNAADDLAPDDARDLENRRDW